MGKRGDRKRLKAREAVRKRRGPRMFGLVEWIKRESRKHPSPIPLPPKGRISLSDMYGE